MPSTRTVLLSEDAATVERAMLAVCGVFGVPRAAVLGRRQSGDAWRARATLCHVLHEAGMVWHDIGLVLGRQHSAPRSAVARLHREMERDAVLRREVASVQQLLSDWARPRAGGTGPAVVET